MPAPTAVPKRGYHPVGIDRRRLLLLSRGLRHEGGVLLEVFFYVLLKIQQTDFIFDHGRFGERPPQ